MGLVLSEHDPARLLLLIIAWKLCATMKTEDVTDTLQLA